MLSKNNLYKKIIISSFVIFIFFFDFLKVYIDFRLVIFIPFILVLYKNPLFIEKKNNKIILSIFALILLLVTQSQTQEISLNDRIYSLKTIVFFIITSFTIWSFSGFILKNIDSIYNYYLVFFLFYLIFFSIYAHDEITTHHQCYLGCFSTIVDKFEFFSENSHIGFISTSLISYLIIKIKKIDVYLLTLLLFYLFLILNFSLTIFFSLLIMSLYFLIFYYKKFNIFQRLIIIFIITFSFYNINVNFSAIDKLYNLIEIDNWKINKIENTVFKKDDVNSNINLDSNKKLKILNTNKKINIIKKIENKNSNKEIKNLSSEVFIVSLNVAKLAIWDRPFGYGINNYHLAFKKYINEITITNRITSKLNVFDASNNLAKMITEFGIFSFLILYIFLKFLFSSKISFEYKFIIFPALFTQTFLRGAGYFNGGYILYSVLVCYLLYKSKD